MSSLFSRNFLTAVLPFLAEDADPDFAALCATSSSFMNGSFVPEYTLKNNLNAETEPIFKLINDFSSTLQFTTKLNLFNPKGLRPVSLLQNQMETKRYFTRQLTSLHCYPTRKEDHRVFVEKCLPHLVALRTLGLAFPDFSDRYTKESYFYSGNQNVRALKPLVNLEDLSIDGSESSDLWLWEIWKLNPMPHLRKLKIIGGRKKCFLRCISSRKHAEKLEVLDLTLNRRICCEYYHKKFGSSWSVPDLRKMKNLRELYLRGDSILEEGVVDQLLGYKNRADRQKNPKEDFLDSWEFQHICDMTFVSVEGSYGSYYDSLGRLHYVAMRDYDRYYAEAHGLWMKDEVELAKTPLIDEDEPHAHLEPQEEEEKEEEVTTGICKKLHTLHFNGCHRGRAAGEVYRIINELGSTWIHDLSLNLEFKTRRGIRIDDTFFKAVIQKMHFLPELNLQNNEGIGNETLIAIGKHCTSLGKLRLPDFSNCTDEGIAALFDPEKSTNSFRTLEELVVGTRRRVEMRYDDNSPPNYEARIFGENWFGPSKVLTEKMSYCLKKLDCSCLIRFTHEGLIQIMDAFSHCLEEFNLPKFNRRQNTRWRHETRKFDVQLISTIVDFPTMTQLSVVTNLPLNVLGFPNIEGFIRACPTLQKLTVFTDSKDITESDESSQWLSFKKERPELKQKLGIPSFNDLLVEAAKRVRELYQQKRKEKPRGDVSIRFDYVDHYGRTPQQETLDAISAINS